jgi:hypothetical protein
MKQINPQTNGEAARKDYGGPALGSPVPGRAS